MTSLSGCCNERLTVSLGESEMVWGRNRKPVPTSKRRQVWARPRLEPLEDRLLLSSDPMWLNPPPTQDILAAGLVQTHGVLRGADATNWYRLDAVQEVQ